MKKILLIGCLALTGLLAEDNCIKAVEQIPEVSKNEKIKGVVLESYGIVVQADSELEKDLKDVLVKHNQIKFKDESVKIQIEPEIVKENSVTVLEPIVVKPMPEIDLKACESCHGQNFEKQALGKSKVVKDLTKTEIETALKGYKDGTYGNTLKGVMKPQASKYNDQEIKQIAEQIKGE